MHASAVAPEFVEQGVRSPGASGMWLLNMVVENLGPVEKQQGLLTLKS